MSTTGRYYVRDPQSGRVFCVEPMSERNQRQSEDAFEKGGITPVKGGSVTEVESIIKDENGFVNIIDLPAGVSPDSYIADLLKKGAP